MPDFITLSCPSCGGRLQITPDLDRFACAHCGNEHIVRRGGGIVSLAPVMESLQGVQASSDRAAASSEWAAFNSERAAINSDLAVANSARAAASSERVEAELAIPRLSGELNEARSKLNEAKKLKETAAYQRGQSISSLALFLLVAAIGLIVFVCYDSIFEAHNDPTLVGFAGLAGVLLLPFVFLLFVSDDKGRRERGSVDRQIADLQKSYDQIERNLEQRREWLVHNRPK